MTPVPPEFNKQSQRNAEKAAERRRTIIERLNAGESQTDIAKSLNVTRTVVWRIAKRARKEGLLPG